MVCKNRCFRFKTVRTGTLGRAVDYWNGVKRCQMCNIYTRIESKYCPCCGQVLRTRVHQKSTNTPRPYVRY